MIRQCAWCKQSMGQAAPVEDKAVTHGICLHCGQRMLREARVGELPGSALTSDEETARSIRLWAEAD